MRRSVVVSSSTMRRQIQTERMDKDQSLISKSPVKFKFGEIVQKDGHFIFQVFVTYQQQEYIINKRFSEFWAFYEHLRATYPFITFPPFPRRTIFRPSLEESTQRRVVLQNFFDEILCRPVIHTDPFLLNFIRPNNDNNNNNDVNDDNDNNNNNVN
jgi:hypothetical protein